MGAHFAQPAWRARVLPAGLGARLCARRLSHHHYPRALARRDLPAAARGAPERRLFGPPLLRPVPRLGADALARRRPQLRRSRCRVQCRLGMTRVAIGQSNYLPWKGYFDLIHDVDLFVFYDDVQYTIRDWRNRNRIKTAHGTRWLTVPVGSSRDRLIQDVAITDGDWQRVHWNTIRHAYARAPHFDRLADYLREIYLERTWTKLYELNQQLTRDIARDWLGIRTE